MRYRLRSLLIWLTLAPLVIALGYWTIALALGWPLTVPQRLQVYLAFLALSSYSCIAIVRGADRMLFGPSAAQSWRRKRRRIRVRIERYSIGST